MHQPVLLNEIILLLQPKPGSIVVDGTIGSGGHSERFIELIQPDGRLIGLDLDENILALARQRLNRYAAQVKLFCDNFARLGTRLKEIGLSQVDVILLDLGVSSYQLGAPQRGFSFQSNGPLDMRLNPTNPLTADQIVNRYPPPRLLKLIQEYGEERWAKRIVQRIVQTRRVKPIKETHQLAEIISEAIPIKRGRIHPATRVFQALRIEVNNELDNLKTFLNDIENYLKPGGRLGVISFHSLEDRIVKIMFRNKMKQGYLGLITKKPVRPAEQEIMQNPRARSARLRVIEKQ